MIEIKEMTPKDLEQMLDRHKELNPDRPIRQDIKESLERYRDHGIEPGGFLTAVLENDLMRSFGLADSYNRATLFQITSFIYNEMPSNCWGSPNIVKAWIEVHQEFNESK